MVIVTSGQLGGKQGFLAGGLKAGVLKSNGNYHSFLLFKGAESLVLRRRNEIFNV